ncbi:aminotransferase class III-fold pyridoxal phosphate-dependent enzyme [Oceaniglobus indicus]|uniref:aminotransferase class III-fold pyridoxal phosphate-dependent enzyme n=1 Tax=Oceaniglobus indicus TaxID=2047749 RepID=UPI000C17D531|nr:aminotransferase class III-fold pyridoxal phosphate-dependent enzyme [Oceaniglobus indicus]
MLRNDALDQWDRASLLHPATHWAQHSRGESPTRIMTGAKDSHVTDRDGNRMLDGFAGLYCVNIGYGRPEVAEAIAKQAHELAYYHSYVGHSTEAAITLAHMVAERTPAHLNKVYFGLGGSDANETNVKLVWAMNNILGRPEKRKIISRWRGYHGSGLVTGSLTGLHLFHKTFNLPLPGFLHADAPYFYRREDRSMDEAAFTAHLVANLESIIEAEGADTIAAFWAEPLLGTGGIVAPPEGYWDAVQAVLKKHDILLVADEVVTGFGRMGTMFGSEYYGMKPDIMTIAKGLTSAYAPLSGSVISDEVAAVLERGTDENGTMGHGWTYSAHPIGAAAGIANLKVLDDLKLIDNVNDVGPYLIRQMQAAVGDHPNVGEVRGDGMLCAVELVEDRDDRVFFDPNRKISAQVVAAMAERNVIARAMPQGDILGYSPPLCLTRDEADTLVTVTKDAIDQVFATI